VNGGQRAGSLSPEFEDMDNSTALPLHLVYARPPSATGNHQPHQPHHHHHQQQQQQYNFSTTTAQRRDRYSTDGVSLVQVGFKSLNVVRSSWWLPISGLRSVTCHMGAHSVICHPTQVNVPHLDPKQAGRYSIYLPRRDGRLS